MSADDHTRRWQRAPSHGGGTDAFDLLRACLARMRAAPGDPEARRQLRAIAAEQGDWDELALLLADEVRAATGRPAVAAAFLEELVDAYENLGRAPETISAMETLVELVPDVVEHHDRLAQLYDRAGAWGKAAEEFERVARLAQPGQARAALRAAARIYRDNARPERAVMAYQAIASRFPSDLEAWRALDELLAELGRWEALADVRAALAARAEDGVAKAAALRAQARALEQAGKADKAAALVMQASLLAPEEVSGLVDYAAVLARGGRGREAAELLAARVAAAISEGAPSEAIAAVRLRLAGVLEDGCGDRAAASVVIEQLLAKSPRYVPALEFLVWQAAQDPDPGVHAAAVLRHAEALDPGPARAALLLEAGRRLRDVGDRAGSVRAFEQASELAPDDAAVAQERDEGRAALLVARAADEARSGDTASAEQRLRALLATRPHDIDANLALANLHAARGQLDAAADQLRATLAAVPDGAPGKPQARLVQRLAEIVAAQGAADEAHQLLHEAHRLDRKDLLITLALGDSCFARRLWREAALHLGALADHPEAALHARAVAMGLVRAAQADVRSLRPANKEMRYAAAVRIDPRCAPAWHALAEIATERADTEGAAEYLEREAAATTDPLDRVRLYDALGDLALDVLDDALRAERCWAQVSDAGSANVLDKLLALQRRRGAGVERAETCERLAEVRPDPRAKKELTEEAVDAYLVGGELPRARAAADRLIAAHPLDVDAVTAATACAVATGDHEATAAWLGRALAAWEATDRADGDPRRAELWRRLGDARRARGDDAGALGAYQRAVAVAPDSDGALAARRGLVAFAAATGGSVADSLAVLVEADHDPADILAWARDCAQTGDGAVAARSLYELAGALGAGLDERDDRFLADHPVRAMASDQAYQVVLDEADRHALIGDADDAPLAAVFDALAEVGPLLCPGAAAALAQAGLAGAERLSSASPIAAASLYPQIGKALAGPTTLLYAAPRAEYIDVIILLAAPPVVVLGPRVAATRAQSRGDVDMVDDAVLRFRLGRAVELARPRRVFAATGAAGSFDRLVQALWCAMVRPDEEIADPEVAAEARRLRSAIPLLVRRRLADLLAAIPKQALDPARYAAACERAADRAGLLACGDIGVALQLAGGPEAARHLIVLAASPRFHAARAALWPPAP